jgi:PmbA protein
VIRRAATQFFIFMLLELDQLKQIAEDILSCAKKHDVTDVETSAVVSDGYTVNVRMGHPETVEYQRDCSIAVTVYFGHHRGSVITSHADQASIEKALNISCNIARFTEEDPCAGLAEASLMAKDFPDLDLYYPWDLKADQAIQLASQYEDYALSLDKRIVNSEGISISSHQTFCANANSHGFNGTRAVTEHDVSCTLVAKNHDGMETDYDFSVARAPSDLKDLGEVARCAVSRTVSRLNPQKLSTRKVPVVLQALIARGLIASFIAAICGNRLYKKSSFLVDHLGKKVFSDQVRIYEEPHLLRGLGSTVFDTDGVATVAKNFVEAGVLQNYVLDHYSACQLGMRTTGNAGGVYNLFIKSSDQDLPMLLKKMDKGVLVTELMGQGINLVTGDYSRGACGFWVEHGKIQYPVSEITIAGNLKDMFLNLVSVGNDIDQRGNIQTGSILLEEMTVAGS